MAPGSTPRAALIAAGALLATLVLPGSARAGDARPLTQPTHDVQVTYLMTKGGHQMRQVLKWQAAGQLQRVDPSPASASYMVADLKSHKVSMINAQTRQYVQVDTPTGPLNGGAADFTKTGTETIAGLSCTDYKVVPAPQTHGVPNDLCLTADGILLGVKVDGEQRVIAEKVQAVSADSAVFTVPPGFSRMDAKAPPKPAP